VRTQRTVTPLRLAGAVSAVALIAGAVLLVLRSDDEPARSRPLRLKTPQEVAEPTVLPPPLPDREEPEAVQRPVVALPIDVAEPPREGSEPAAREAHDINVLVLADGAPEAGAKVEIWWRDPLLSDRQRPAAVLTTDKAGLAGARVKGNAFRLVAQRADGSAVANANVQRNMAKRLADGRRGFVIELQLAALVRGVVLDVRGNPAPAAVVKLEGKPANGSHGNPRVFQVDADARGRFEARVDPGTFRVTAESGAARSFDQMVLAEPGSVHDVTLELPGDWWLQGLVHDEHGRPTPMARVTLWQDLPRDDDGNFIPVPWNKTRLDIQADVTGRFRVDLPRLAAGTLIAFTEPPHPAPGWRSHAVEVSAEDATWHRDVALQILPPAEIAGHVQDPDGRPLKGKVTIRLACGPGARDADRRLAMGDRIGKAFVNSKEDGAFALSPLLAGAAYDLGFESAEGEAAFLGELLGVPAGAQGVTLVARPDAERAGVLRGAVLGDPARSCAQVTAAWQGDDGQWALAATETRDSRFVLGGLPVDRRGLLRITTQAGNGLWLDNVDLSGRSGEITVTLPAPGGLELEIRGEGDKPVKVPSVALANLDGEEKLEDLRPKVVLRSTDDSGRASFEGLEPGRWRVRCHCSGGATASLDVVIEPGAVRHEVIRLSP
jgi:hypothetical protein